MNTVLNQVLDKQKSSYDWIKYLPSSVLQWDEVPLLGCPPSFPWDGLSASLSQLFNIQNLKIELTDTQWRTHEDLLQGYVNPLPLFFSITSIEGHVTWIMNRSDLETILSSLIIKAEAPPPLTDSEFLEGFYQFIAIETLHSLSQLEWDKSLAIHTFLNGELPDETALCLDVTISFPPKKFNGRLLISNAFRKSWTARYTPKTPDAYFASPLAEQLTLPIGIEAGKSTLTQKEWMSIHPGDYLILDHCSIDPESHHGQVVININNKAIFDGQLTSGNVKILNLTHSHEETAIMKNPPHEDDHDYDDEDEMDFDEEEFDLDDDEEEDHDFDDEEFDEDFESETSLNFDENHHTHHHHEKHKKEKETSSTETVADVSVKSEHAPVPSELFSPSELPLSISIEIGRIQLSIQKLMQLAPGNMLELGAKTDNQVDLIYNGKCIARGELLRIGDTLGVRITEKG